MSNPNRKIALGLSAFTLLPVGTLVTFFPASLYALNGLVLDPSAAMMSEIRAPGVFILLAGVLALCGLFRQALEGPALLASAGLLLSYGIGRLISLPLDGLPPVSLLVAMGIEVCLGTWCAVLYADRVKLSGQFA
ncbi:DUF4345 domain-containing protein [Roseibium album]|uniref:DUF4345 domain-containing protein n=1 Tax=Roseibium album TaxID=311410 RepID=UPI000D552CF8|nr:DUF4345 domain-containing protein [Roseibium album]MCR9061245.1 DUF4345 domain-containing protein [Paracoccaceae bacterium]